MNSLGSTGRQCYLLFEATAPQVTEPTMVADYNGSVEAKYKAGRQ